MNIEIRKETPADIGKIDQVVLSAFDNAPGETALVRLIRDRNQATLSLVAVVESEVSAHVMVSPITLHPSSNLILGGVAPVSVTPSRQQLGVGSQLMRGMIEAARAIRMDALFLTGDPDYYSRFGFSTSHIGNEYGATDAFMHLELTGGCLQGVEGKATYVSAFNDVGV